MFADDEAIKVNQILVTKHALSFLLCANKEFNDAFTV